MYFDVCITLLAVGQYLDCTACWRSHSCPSCLVIPSVYPDLQSEYLIPCLFDLAPITLPLKLTQVSPHIISIPVFFQQNFSQCLSVPMFINKEQWLHRALGAVPSEHSPALPSVTHALFLHRSPFSPVSAVVSDVARCQRAYSAPVGCSVPCFVCLKEQSK